MNPRYKPLLWMFGAVALGLALVFTLRGLGDRDGDADAPVDAPAAVDTPLQVSAPAAAAEDTPPWMQGAATPSGTTAGVGSAAALNPLNGAMTPDQAADPVAAIASIRVQAERNVRAVDTLMVQLDALEASGQTPPEVELDALRDNLKLARRAQELALEMAESTQQPDSPQRELRTAQIIAELQTLQDQLRHNNAPAATAGAATAGRTQ